MTFQRHSLFLSTDGRNHAPCCYRRGIPDHCIPFCANLLTTELMSIVHTDDAYDECLAVSVDIVACFEEGQSMDRIRLCLNFKGIS